MFVELYRIHYNKKNVLTFFKIPRANWGGGGSGQVGQKPTFLIQLFLTLPLFGSHLLPYFSFLTPAVNSSTVLYVSYQS